MININPKIVIYVGIFLAIVAPYIFTQFGIGVYFGTPNEIGGTIGGITSPIIGIMGAILVYLTFEQQNRAIQQPIELEKKKREVSEKLILLDLDRNLIPAIHELKKECIELYENLTNDGDNDLRIKGVKYVGFSLDIYNSIGLERLFLIFKEDVFELFAIYRRVEYFGSINLKNMFEEHEKRITNIDSSTEEGLYILEAHSSIFIDNLFIIIKALDDNVIMINKIIDKYPIKDVSYD